MPWLNVDGKERWVEDDKPSNVLKELKKAVFKDTPEQDPETKTMADMVERVKDIQHERRVALERVAELEGRINQMRGVLQPLKELIWR